MFIDIVQTRFSDASSLRECIDSDSVHLVALEGRRVVAWARIERSNGSSPGAVLTTRGISSTTGVQDDYP